MSTKNIMNSIKTLIENKKDICNDNINSTNEDREKAKKCLRILLKVTPILVKIFALLTVFKVNNDQISLNNVAFKDYRH